MAYTYHGTAGWIKQPNRIVKTFDSGLCLIQQDYIRRKDKVEYFTFKQGDALSVADSKPCIDGAFIFPEPDYQDMGNGYIKCTITAYGRVNKTGSVTVRKKPVALTAVVGEIKQGILSGICKTTGGSSVEDQVALYSGPDPGLVDIPIIKIVLGAHESPSTIIPANLVNVFVAATGENITNKLFFPQIRGFNEYNSIPVSLGGNFEGRKLQTEFRIDRVETTDYGRFKEYTLSWRIVTEPSVNLGGFIRKGGWNAYGSGTIITATSIGSSTFTFTGGANYAVLNQPGCVLPQLQVNKTDVLVKQASTTITAFTTAQPAVIGQVIVGLTPNTYYEITVTCANNFVSIAATLGVTTI